MAHRHVAKHRFGRPWCTAGLGRCGVGPARHQLVSCVCEGGLSFWSATRVHASEAPSSPAPLASSPSSSEATTTPPELKDVKTTLTPTCCSHHSAGCAEASAHTLGRGIGHARRNRNAICRAVDRQHGARKACVDAAAATDKLRGAIRPDEGGDGDAQLALADEPPARPAAARPGRGRNVNPIGAGPGLEGHMLRRRGSGRLCEKEWRNE